MQVLDFAAASNDVVAAARDAGQCEIGMVEGRADSAATASSPLFEATLGWCDSGSVRANPGVLRGTWSWCVTARVGGEHTD